VSDAPTGPPPGPPGGIRAAGEPTALPVHHSARRQWIAIGIVVVLVVLAVALTPTTSGGANIVASTSSQGEKFLPVQRTAASTAGDNPFTTSVVSTTPTAPTLPAATVPPTAIVTSGLTTQDGSTPGLYGGTRNLATCDSALLVSFLQANAGQARAFASTQGIAVGDIATYVAGLTSVILRADTAVTNHGYDNGVATPIQSVLQAGTAVLVDRFGVPRVRCFCGNPLGPPASNPQPTYTGPTWQGFDPSGVVTVAPAPAPLVTIVLVDVNTGQPFSRATGTSGKDSDPPPSTTTTTAPAASTTTLPAGRNLSGVYAIVQTKPTFSGSQDVVTPADCDKTAPGGTKTTNAQVTVIGRTIAISDAGKVAGKTSLNGTYDPATGAFSASRPIPPPTSSTTETQRMTGTIDASGRITGTLVLSVDPPAASCTTTVTASKL